LTVGLVEFARQSDVPTGRDRMQNRLVQNRPLAPVPHKQDPVHAGSRDSCSGRGCALFAPFDRRTNAPVRLACEVRYQVRWAAKTLMSLFGPRAIKPSAIFYDNVPYNFWILIPIASKEDEHFPGCRLRAPCQRRVGLYGQGRCERSRFVAAMIRRIRFGLRQIRWR
jgi:hypothetical protein